MINKRIAGILLLLLASTAWAAGDSTYTLGSGDVITIRVFGEEELTFEEIRLTDAGTISYPFIGEIRAAGKTGMELEKIIGDALRADYLVDPKVSVRIIHYREFYVNGEVKSPGGYAFQPGLTIRKAVALAGGFSDWASKSKIYIIRETGSERKPVKADLDSVVKPGDIVTVEQSLF